MKLIFNNGGIGDTVIISAVAENIGTCLVASCYDELLLHHPNITLVDYDASKFFKKRYYNELLRKNIQPYMMHYMDLEKIPSSVKYSWHYPYIHYKYRWKYPSIHLIAKLCAMVGYFGYISIKPRLYLTDQEIETGRLFFVPYIVMQSTGAIWKTCGFNTFASVAKKLRKDFLIVQIGHPDDKELPYAKNLCGKLTLRQVAILLYHAKAFIGTIGGPMHIARAVETRSVITFTDSEPEYFSGYIANEHAKSEISCELCQKNILNMFNGEICPYNYRCGASISEQGILSAFERLYSRLNEPLEVAIVNNSMCKNHISPRTLYKRLTKYRTLPDGWFKEQA